MGRKLRVLMIDDEPSKSLGTRHLTRLDVPQYHGGESTPEVSLSNWAQHLWLWASDQFPAEDADLILIDCNFHNDRLAPQLKAARDPRGLLHGALYVARMFGRDRFLPFGFSLYSQNASVFEDDPYAQTFVGFLLAMQNSTEGEEVGGFLKGKYMRDIPAMCGEFLKRTVRSYPATGWRPAVEMYRSRLRQVLQLGAAVLALDSRKEVLDALKQGDERAFDSGLSLKWRRFDNREEEVEMRSLFVDLLQNDRWTARATQEALSWLDNLPALADYLPDVLDWVDRTNRDGAPPAEIKLPRASFKSGTLVNFAHAASAVVGWLVDRDLDQNTSSTQLLRDIGLEQNMVDRYFKRQLGLTWGAAVQELDRGRESFRWPWPGQKELRWVVEQWANTRKVKFPFRS